MATVSMFFDKRNAKEGEQYIKWSVFHERKNKMFSTGLILGDEYVIFLKQYKNGLNGHVKDTTLIHLWDMIYGDSYLDESKKYVHSYLQRAKNVVKKLGNDFDFDSFKKEILNYDKIKGEFIVSDVIDSDDNNVIQYLLDQYTFMHGKERFGSGDSFRDSANSLTRYMAKIGHIGNLKFDHVTHDFLLNYEEYMLREGKSPKKKDGKFQPASISTIGFYTRNIRTVFNLALNAKIIDKKQYPFGEDLYVPPKGRNIKKARTIEEIQAIMEFYCRSEVEQRSRDFWLFSYLGNGANFSDILRLRKSRLEDSEFSFIREKTKRTKKHNIKPVHVYMSELALEIIARWGNPDAKDDDYIFPILTKEMSAHEAHKKVKLFIALTNDYMNRIAAKLGIKGNVNTYSARHSFADIMLNSGANLVMISNMLDHSTLAMTQFYFGDFADKNAISALTALIPVKKVVEEVVEEEVLSDGLQQS